MYGADSIRIGGANDAGFRSLNSELVDRHVSWRNPKSKFRYLEAPLENLVEVTRSIYISLLGSSKPLVFRFIF